MFTTRVFVCLAIAFVLATSVGSVAQIADTDVLQVSYFANATSTRYGDQVIRILNTGVQGSPVTTKGPLCADLYVFDANQKMEACCSCKVLPNQTITVSLAKNLLAHPVDASTPSSGVIKLLSSLPQGGTCNAASNVSPAATLRATMEHLELIVPVVRIPIAIAAATPFLSLAQFQSAGLSGYELDDLLGACGNIAATNACTCP